MAGTRDEVRGTSELPRIVVGLSRLPRQRRGSRRIAARRVAGGRARSARPPEHERVPIFRPRQRSRREFTPLSIWYATPAGVELPSRTFDPGRLALRARPPATVRVASGDETGFPRHVPRCLIPGHLLRAAGIARLPRFLGIFAIARLPEIPRRGCHPIKVKTEVRPNAQIDAR